MANLMRRWWPDKRDIPGHRVYKKVYARVISYYGQHRLTSAPLVKELVDDALKLAYV